MFLKHWIHCSTRCFTTDKGTSAVGLTVSVRLEHSTQERESWGWHLIVESDKMSEKDHTSIHETMEQQSISISKGGCHHSSHGVLRHCCLQLDPRGLRLLLRRIPVSQGLFSRLDVLCVFKNVVISILDANLAEYMIRSHQGKAHRSGLNEDIKYISYAFEAPSKGRKKA